MAPKAEPNRLLLFSFSLKEWKIIYMEKKPEAADLLRLAFIFFGAVQILIGINLLSDDMTDSVGYMMSGSGLALLGFSFSADYFLVKPGDSHAHMTLTTKVVCIAGFAVVVLGDRLASL